LHKASPSGLSQSAVLNEEAGKYAKVLMQLEMNQFGKIRGPFTGHFGTNAQHLFWPNQPAFVGTILLTKLTT
jgi:hypothetical protein